MPTNDHKSSGDCALVWEWVRTLNANKMNWSLCRHQRTFIWHFIVLPWHPPTYLINTPSSSPPGKEDYEEMKEEETTSLWSSSSIQSPIHPMNMMSTGKGSGEETQSHCLWKSLIVKSICSRPMIYEWPADHLSPTTVYRPFSVMIAFMKSMRFVSSCHDRIRNLKEEILHCIHLECAPLHPSSISSLGSGSRILEINTVSVPYSLWDDILWSGIQGEWRRTISFNGDFIAAGYILCGCNLFLRVENKL